MKEDFFAALADLEKEKGIPQQVFLDALQNAHDAHIVRMLPLRRTRLLRARLCRRLPLRGPNLLPFHPLLPAPAPELAADRKDPSRHLAS